MVRIAQITTIVTALIVILSALINRYAASHLIQLPGEVAPTKPSFVAAKALGVRQLRTILVNSSINGSVQPSECACFHQPLVLVKPCALNIIMSV